MEDTYELSAVSTLQDAVNTILKFLGLGADSGSGKVNQGVHTHTLLSSGEFMRHIAIDSILYLNVWHFILGAFRGGHEVLLRAKLALSEGVAMQLTVRSTSPEVAETVSSAIG